MGRYKEHKQTWKNCQLCPLHRYRTNIVLARGRIPAPILFVGEAPGNSEDVIGQPFVGPAGKLLDYVIRESIEGKLHYTLVNLVACIPKDDHAGKMGEPPKESIKACSPRLFEMIEMVNPKVIIRVGSLASKWVPALFELDKSIKQLDIIHPAAILRMNVAQQSLAIKRCIVTLLSCLER